MSRLQVLQAKILRLLGFKGNSKLANLISRRVKQLLITKLKQFHWTQLDHNSLWMGKFNKVIPWQLATRVARYKEPIQLNQMVRLASNQLRISMGLLLLHVFA